MKHIATVLVLFYCISTSAQLKKGTQSQTTKPINMQHYSTLYDNDHQVFKLNTSMPFYDWIFARSGFKKPDEELFRKKIWEYCGVDISQVNGNDAPFFIGDGDAYPIILDKRLLITCSQDVEPTLEQIAFQKVKYPPMDACVAYNKIMFYDDPAAIADVIRIDDDYYAAFFLVGYLKYEKHNLLTQKAIRQMGDIHSDDSLAISNILFYHFNNKVDGKRYRRELVRRILHQYEGADYSSVKSVLGNFLIEKVGNYSFTQDEKDKYLCYFLEECLTIAGWGVGDTRSQCYSDTAFSQRIAKKNYYGLPLLIALSRNTDLVYTAERMNELEPSAPEFGDFPMGTVPRNAIHGIINDPDGYVNVRKEKSVDSRILDQIVRGEEFLYWENINSDWWQVMTKNLASGFVHKSRIQKAE